MRKMILGIAALLLSACGGTTYQVPAGEAFSSLSSIGTTPGMSPLPGGLEPVNASFESVEGDNAVKWHFTHDGEDIGQIVAQVAPNGATASTVTVWYIEGSAPDDHWRNTEARRLIKGQIQRLVVEAVDSTLTSRPFDAELKKDVVMQVSMSSIGSMMNDVSKSMDEAAAEFDRRDEEARVAHQAAEARSVGKPTTDLGGSTH